MRRLTAAALAAVMLAAGACGGSDDVGSAATTTTGAGDATSEARAAATPDDTTVEELYPEVVRVEAAQDADGTWTFHVTISSPYDTPERYADAWRIEAPDGTVLGIRELAHDHQNEQPFTRSTSGVEIPEDLDEVVIRGRDQVSGWSPEAIEHVLSR